MATSQHLSKGTLVYENSLTEQALLSGWVMEGPGVVSFEDDRMHMRSPNEAGHHVFWCPQEMPESFIAEWEVQNQETDAGLCIVFFAAKGINGEDIFSADLSERDGAFKSYIKGDINNYHISYYANAKNKPGREITNLRKNRGFHKVQSQYAGIPTESTAVHQVKLIKHKGTIQMFIDGRTVVDWTDDGEQYGPILGSGNIGLRQMKFTHFTYRNFKVWSIAK